MLKMVFTVAILFMVSGTQVWAQPTSDTRTTEDANTAEDANNMSLHVSASGARRLNIVFVNPSSKDDRFWNDFQTFMEAAAQDLNIDLDVMHSERDALIMLDNIRKITNRPDRPDAVIFQNLKKNGEEAIEIMNDAGIPSFVVNAGVDYAETGLPRRRYTHWLGDLIPDDEVAGYTMALLLVETARLSGLVDADGNVNILAFSGTISDKASEERVAGLERAVAELENVVLQQIVTANWSEDLALEKFYWLHERYPETHVVWSASDSMAIGVAKRAADMEILSLPNSERYVDLLVGGVDWIAPARELVQSGDMVLSMGGHFMDGAWALVLLRDYFDGIDFASSTTQLRSQHSVLNSTNIDAYQEYMGDSTQWGAIDFRVFSKSYSPELQSYDFSLDAILQQFVTN